MRLRQLGFIAATVLVGCATGGSALKISPTITAAQLPADVPGLVRYSDAELQKRTLPAMANVMAATDKLLTLDPKSVEAWRGARATAYIIEELSDKKARGDYAEKGVAYAKVTREAAPDRVEGQYWYGINLGLLAQTKVNGNDYVKDVLAAGKEAVRLDEKYDYAGPLRLVGTLYAKAPPPPVSEGDVEEGVKTLDRAVQLYPGYPQNVLHLADALLANDKFTDAERRFQQVLNAPSEPAWASRLEMWKKAARDGIRRVARKREAQRSGGDSPF